MIYTNFVELLSQMLHAKIHNPSGSEEEDFLRFLKLFILVGWGRSFLSVAWPTGVQLLFSFCSGVSKLFGAQGSPSSGSLLNLLSPRF